MLKVHWRMAHVPERYEDMSSDATISFPQIAQLHNKFVKMGWDAARITKLGQANQKTFRSIEALLDGVSLEKALQPGANVLCETAYLSFLESVSCAPTSGQTTLAKAKGVFTGFLDPDLKNWVTNIVGDDTLTMPMDIYEINKNGKVKDFFLSLGRERKKLYSTQGQIIEFCRTHRDKLRQDGFATFFLFEVAGQSEPFVACVFVGGGALRLLVFRFELDVVFDADDRRRVVVSQLET
jgi:hypothetical protein